MKNLTYYTDLIKNLFTNKYSKREILEVLAELEKDKSKFTHLIKIYQPNYYNKWDNSVTVFSLIRDLNITKEKDGKCIKNT